MNMEIGTERKPRLFYGWWIVLAGFFVVAYGTAATGYVTRTNFLFKELGFASKTAIALIIFSGGMAIASWATGPLIDKFGPRKLMLVGIPVASIALLGLGFADSPPYMLMGVFAVGMSAGFLLPVQTATANWFIKKRSIALAIICAAPAAVGPIAKLVEDQSTGQLGSQSTLTVVMGLFIGIISVGFPALHGWVLDTTGGNPVFFLLSMLIGFLAAGMFLFAKPPESPQKASAEIESET